MKRIILLLAILIIFVFQLNSEVFRFKYNKSDKYKIEGTIEGEQYQNGVLLSKYVHTYKNIRSIKEVHDNIADIEDNVYYYNQNTFYDYSIKEITHTNIVNYKRNKNGKVEIDKNEKFPTYRNVPTFPEKNIEPGYKWEAKGTEVQDLFNDGRLSLIPINVQYTFLGYDEINNKKLAKFELIYEINLKNVTNNVIHPRIKKIIGKSKTIMYFDNKQGRRVKETFERHFGFLIQSGLKINSVEFIDTAEKDWHSIELMDKDKIVKDIQKDIEREKIENATVEKDEKGIKISLENIHFHPDSSEFLPGEIERLNKIANIIKDFKDRGIMIIGHTALAGTEKGRKELSIERAKVVMDHLIKLDAINLEKSSYGGKGGIEPVASNDTEEGMKKNRRVEIYILEE